MRCVAFCLFTAYIFLLLLFYVFKKILVNTYATKSAILAIFNIQFNVIKYIHIVVLPSPPPISVTLIILHS